LSDLILLYLIFLEHILKLLEDGFKETCGADGVYMVLKKQRLWDRFECRWATIEQEVVCRLYGFSGQLQCGEGNLFILC